MGKPARAMFTTLELARVPSPTWLKEKTDSQELSSDLHRLCYIMNPYTYIMPAHTHTHTHTQNAWNIHIHAYASMLYV